MKLGVLSDSHDQLDRIRDALEVFARAEVDGIIHAGDFVAPFAAKPIAAFAGPVYAVFGNNDGEHPGLCAAIKGIVPGPLQIELGHRRIVVHHILDQIPDDVIAWAEIVIFGHTHKIVNERRRGKLYLNPGETCGWLTGSATVAILEPEDMKAGIVRLGE